MASELFSAKIKESKSNYILNYIYIYIYIVLKRRKLLSCIVPTSSQKMVKF